MSLLQQDYEQTDDAARGESFTRGTSHILVAAIAATILVTAAIAAYVIAGRKPAPATGEVVGVWAWPHHAETSGFDASGARVPSESFDQMLVFADVRIHNQTKGPLFLTSSMINLTLPDGSVHTAYAASPSEYDRIFSVYGNVPVPHGPALPLQAFINPGQTLEGTMVAAFRVDKQQWDARKAIDLAFTFRYQPPLHLTPQSITDR
ncbi:MAG TPA: hypothetical protein VMA34_07815 [Terracidiphilus sp.]|nr:hypothetical protein [Terracidiphilus sp.]